MSRYYKQVLEIIEVTIEGLTDLQIAETLVDVDKYGYERLMMLRNPGIFLETIEAGVSHERVVEFAKRVVREIGATNYADRFPDDWESFKNAVDDL